MVEIVSRSVGECRPDPRNVNTHPEDQIAQIAASIRDFGFNDPIALDQHGMIVEGHGRLVAALRLGLREVPTITIHFDSDAERRAYAIAHNQTQLCSNMDEGVVLDEIQRIGVATDKFQAIGYSADDIAFMELDRMGSAVAPDTGAGFASRAAVETKLEFHDQDQMLAWLTGLDWLRDDYPDALTVADRLLALAGDYVDAL